MRKKTLFFKIRVHLAGCAREVFDVFHGTVVVLIRLIQEHRIERSLNIQTDKIGEWGHFKRLNGIGLHEDSHAYDATAYYRLKAMVDCLSLKPEDVFIDFGCGRGRAVFYMSTQRLKKVIGVEFDKELLDEARENLANLKLQKTPVELVHVDAASYRITDENIFFMYNPFGLKTLQAILKNIKNSLVANPRPIRIIFFTGDYKDPSEELNHQDWLSPSTKIIDRVYMWSSTLS
jgi:SAM-dependent methyltransferase